MRRRRAVLLLSLIGIATAIAAVVGLAGGPAASVIVFPMPGSRVAPPQTQIVFRGIPISKLGAVRVTGSRSGVHAGRVFADSDGQGGSFVPARPFSPGERVTVTTRPNLLSHGRSFSFTVATPAGPIQPAPRSVAFRTAGDLVSYHSRPDLQPPAVQVSDRSAGAAGDIFLGPEHGPVQSGPMIIDAGGNLVWFHPLPGDETPADFRVQSYEGKPVLTWWQGQVGAGVGSGEDVIFDSSYKQLAVVHAGNGLSADLHEFLLEPGDRALITAYYPVYWDASSIHQSTHTVVLDSVVQEIDIKTGLVLFQWDSLDHVPLSDSYEPAPTIAGHPYDYFHINSIQRDHGDLVISARNTWAAYKVNPSTGHTVWTLGGKASTFKMPRAAVFAFQHHVRVRSHDRIVTLFDDGSGPPIVHQQSRALTLKINHQKKTVSVVNADYHSPSILASFEGDEQELPNGDDFVGWGQQPYFSEFTEAGATVLDGRFVGGNSSYRAYLYPWRGFPDTPPAVKASTSGSITTVYASWNGATDVSRWQVLGGMSPNKLAVLTTAAKRGFETQVDVPARPFVAVRALDSRGRVLSTSSIVRTQ